MLISFFRPRCEASIKGQTLFVNHTFPLKATESRFHPKCQLEQDNLEALLIRNYNILGNKPIDYAALTSTHHHNMFYYLLW